MQNIQFRIVHKRCKMRFPVLKSEQYIILLSNIALDIWIIVFRTGSAHDVTNGIVREGLGDSCSNPGLSWLYSYRSNISGKGMNRTFLPLTLCVNGSADGVHYPWNYNRYRRKKTLPSNQLYTWRGMESWELFLLKTCNINSGPHDQTRSPGLWARMVTYVLHNEMFRLSQTFLIFVIKFTLAYFRNLLLIYALKIEKKWLFNETDLYKRYQKI